MKPKILSVDDNPANLVAVRRLLGRFDDIELVEASTGSEALAATLDHEFALILLDVYMPDMDGFEVATLLSQEQSTRTTPIIFVTATYADDLHRMKGYQFGAVDYITKPLDERVLVSKVQVFLELYRSRAALRHAMDDLAERNRLLEREIAERKRAELEVMHLATHDPLTGLPNRRLFLEKLDAAVRPPGHEREAFVLIYLDIDNFKPINDEYGHQTGDRVLVVVAQRITMLLRDNYCFARLGGDEFAIMLPGVDLALALAHAERIANSVEAPIDIPSVPKKAARQIELRISIGIAQYPLHGQCSDQIIHAADEAMYGAKRDRTGPRVAVD